MKKGLRRMRPYLIRPDPNSETSPDEEGIKTHLGGVLEERDTFGDKP